MEFTMESRYGKKTLADMSRALRKTTRKKSNRRSMIWAWVVLALNLLFFLTPGEEGFVWNWNRILNGAAALLMIFVILRQDAINGFFARKRMLKGNGYSRVTFGEEGYTSTTENAMTQWSYQALAAIGESEENLILFWINAMLRPGRKIPWKGERWSSCGNFSRKKPACPSHGYKKGRPCRPFCAGLC